MKTMIASIVLLVSSVSFGADFKCFSSKYPADMNHAFNEGYTVLSVNGPTVSLKYFYVNTVANNTTLKYEANYTVESIKGGSGKLSGLYIAKTQELDKIGRIYLEPALLGEASSGGVIGKFVFPGHGYGYDWNLCYAINK
ncbi:hypothetical protein [Bdellovibrio sp. HCB209]|uniref:hypothetical protein n=1 Tax=Bdellovibrio sp. HCB209 TaxID=3394354 RepID=UPI0039B3B62F